MPSPQELLPILQNLLETAPPFEYQQPIGDEELRWLGRSEAAIAATGVTSAVIDFRLARSHLNGYSHDRAAIIGALYNSYYAMEMKVPEAMQGRFIAPQDTWQGYAALVRIMRSDCKDLLIVDPYVDARFFTELLPHAVAKDHVRCLTSRNGDKAALRAAFEKWNATHPESADRVEVRYAPPRSLHDRLIMIDSAKVWLVSQSLKDIAERSPASLVIADNELSVIKRDFYQGLWDEAESILVH